MTVADRIKKSREENGLTQEELAKRMGYASKSAVSRTENAGDNIGQKRIREFAKALNVTESYLMGWSEDFTPTLKNGRTLLEFIDSAMKTEERIKNDPEYEKLINESMEISFEYMNADKETQNMVKRILNYTQKISKKVTE